MIYFGGINMAYRYTNTEKWQDAWFSSLDQMQMLLFIYLCDNCDIAGFIELNYKRWANDLSSSVKTIEGACKGLARGLIYSNTNDCIFIRNFIKHQKNLPLNPNNKAHQGIIKRFDLYSKKFNIQDIKEFIQRGFEGATKGLQSPTGNGNGICIVDTWRTNFEIYKQELRDAYLKIYEDEEWVKARKEYHPNVDIYKSIEKVCVEYWSLEKGWKKKKASKSEQIDWPATFMNSLNFKENRVYEQNRK